MDRKKFIQYLGVLAVAPTLVLQQCHPNKKYTITSYKSNSTIGHILKNKVNIGTITQTRYCDVAIVGSGVAGLSAALHLQKNSNNIVHIIEMQDVAGGNAFGDKTTTHSRPWGAHYLPIPGLHLTQLLAWLQEVNIITGWQNNLPIYNEDFVCFANQERLFINNNWQDGLVPNLPYEANYTAQKQKFVLFINELSTQKDDSGVYYFDIPQRNSSKEAKYNQLHTISAAQWLAENNYNSQALLWYINYCISDDYGSSLETTSAWAMLHYFAGRKGLGVGVGKDDLLTWPEGNYYLIAQFLKQIKHPIFYNEIVVKLQDKLDKVIITQYQPTTNTWIQTIAKKVILNTPIQVLKKLIPWIASHPDLLYFKHFPWLVANITLHTISEKTDVALSWDNVIYQASGLGYIVANHQQLASKSPTQIITFYKVYNTNISDSAARTAVYNSTLADFEKQILADLTKAHPTIQNYIIDIQTMVHGHGMIAPTPGLLTSNLFQKLQAPLSTNIYLAHTDYCGFSIFEEGFYAGIQAATQLLQSSSSSSS